MYRIVSYRIDVPSYLAVYGIWNFLHCHVPVCWKLVQ